MKEKILYYLQSAAENLIFIKLNFNKLPTDLQETVNKTEKETIPKSINVLIDFLNMGAETKINHVLSLAEGINLITDIDVDKIFDEIRKNTDYKVYGAKNMEQLLDFPIIKIKADSEYLYTVKNIMGL
ncbi:hypothetical protein [Chryseobacterium rhizosphaerae]|uniref:PIN domain-containing protein n=1 Tax=Chryseobacterium rhizosphaerae TaxID=395937 RepID=A0ABX9IRL9_9FLAO|nr:hypothetical protein [Chryseobacterium rhizosphaerae]REC78972.1 hypothetical protein DRF57_01465 [Chryseobacterium rhizosphaerae]GEN68061.1 hypothetical protein CRH01_26290 [Chryseobacterium rhizosphaerae]